jgi:hypothetical protein
VNVDVDVDVDIDLVVVEDGALDVIATVARPVDDKGGAHVHGAVKGYDQVNVNDHVNVHVR